MNIAVVGKWSNTWGAEHSVQRGFWALGHEVQTIPLGDNGLSSIREADLTVVMQGYGLSPKAIISLQRRTCNPVVCWHGEVLGDHWPTEDAVVQRKVASLMENLHAYDLVLHNCHTSLDMLRALGAKKAAWCPVNGVDPRIHERQHLTKQIDVGVYGWASARRMHVVKAVCAALGSGVTVAWPKAEQDGVYGTALVQYLCAVKVVLNVHFSQTLNTENRLYEALGCGTPVVSEPISMPDVFPDGWGIHYGATPEILADHIRAVLKMDWGEYHGFGDQGYELVHQRYTYQARCALLLDTVAKELP